MRTATFEHGGIATSPPERILHLVHVGDSVQVRDFRRLPLAGYFGSVVEVDHRDTFGPCLVLFGNGLQFRYQVNDLIDLTNTSNGDTPH